MENVYADLSIDSDCDVDYTAFQIDEPLKKIEDCAKNLTEIFSRWIASIDINKANPKQSLMDLFDADDSMFLSFNYTSTLETIYGIDSVCHIHGYVECGDVEAENIMVGHGKCLLPYSYEPGVKVYIGEMASLEDEERIHNRAIRIYNDWGKDVSSNIERHQALFSQLSAVKEIYSYGFSYGCIDVPYIERIINSLDNTEDIHWYLNDYKLDANERLSKIIRHAGFRGHIENYSM